MKQTMYFLAFHVFFCCQIIQLQAQQYNPLYIAPNDNLNIALSPTATIGGQDGSILMTGVMNKSGAVQASGKEMAFICKFNSAGGLDWVYEYRHSEDEGSSSFSYYPTAITTTYPDNDIVIAGNAYEGTPFFSSSQAFVIKVDQNGTKKFSRTYDCVLDNSSSPTPCYASSVNDIVSNFTNDVILVGKTQPTEDGTSWGSIRQIDQNGDPTLSHTKTISLANLSSRIMCITSAGYDDYLMLITNSNEIYKRTVLLKVNSSFQTIWSKDIVDDEGIGYEPTEVIVSSDLDKIYVIGGPNDPEESHHQIVTQLSVDGFVNWTKRYNHTSLPGTSWVYSLPKASRDWSDNLYLSSTVFERRDSIDTNWSTPLTALLKISADGNIIWSKLHGDTTSQTTLYDITMISNNSSSPFTYQYLAGVGVGNSSSSGLNGMKVGIRLNDGSTDCIHSNTTSQKTPLSYSTVPWLPEINDLTPIYFTQPINKETINPVASFCNPFIDFNHHGKISLAMGKTMEWTIYPNPNSGSFTLKIPKGGQMPSEVKVFDLSGKLIKHFNTKEKQEEFHFSGLAKGVYLLQCIQGKERSIQKVVVQ